MTAVLPVSQCHIIKESTTARRAARTTQQTGRKGSVVAANNVTDDVSEQSNTGLVDVEFCGEPFAVRRARKTRQACHEVSVAAANDVIPDVSEQSNRNSVEDGFCGETFADKGELLSSLSPLLFSMKLCGLYFRREPRHRRRTDDPEWNQTKTTAGTSSTRLRVYATVILILAWVNFVRFTSIFTSRDHFGAILLIKIVVFSWCGLFAIFQTAYYFACHTGRLVKILLTLPVTYDCVRRTHRVTVGLTAFVWMTVIGNSLGGGYVYFNSTEDHNFILAPFFTYINIPKDNMKVAQMVGFFSYILIFPGIYFAHAISMVLVYIFYNQFKKLNKNFRHALGKRGQFSKDLSVFRRRHQTLSRAVSKVDGFMRLSNVAGFVCHISNIIIMLYSIIFYPETMRSFVSAATYLSYLFWNINGLLYSASAGIIVNHMVGHNIRFYACFFSKPILYRIYLLI